MPTREGDMSTKFAEKNLTGYVHIINSNKHFYFLGKLYIICFEVLCYTVV